MYEKPGAALDAAIKRTGMDTPEFAAECYYPEGGTISTGCIRHLRNDYRYPNYRTAIAIVAALNRLRAYSFELKISDLWPESALPAKWTYEREQRRARA